MKSAETMLNLRMTMWRARDFCHRSTASGRRATCGPQLGRKRVVAAGVETGRRAGADQGVSSPIGLNSTEAGRLAGCLGGSILPLPASRAFLSIPRGSLYLSPNSLPVLELTKCRRAQAGHATCRKDPLGSVPGSASQCCNCMPVFGHLMRIWRPMPKDIGTASLKKNYGCLRRLEPRHA